ncbi:MULTISPECIES: hypothetical protein [Neobacillus]|uniref:Uncharacterized protein n=1 Tax=Neobacillus rhizophilus TaxID=2833579 RepID=A0A942U4F8_9BACI|nr:MULTISPECIES: hypothetical protein [Neobacillus]MBS4214536.1 hypothetical protein [Neobacillus rhizophilus]MBU8918440.1 hypothetical protein [Bacillus sp. FJAT-29953]
MEKENKFPEAMNDMGTPAEMSPVKDITDADSKAPMVEVNQPVDAQDPLEIRSRGSVTVL